MLDYVALGILIFAGITLFYGIIVIHDIPYEIAVHRNHPHQDAIHYAGWVSLFTLHAIWPFLWIWSTLYREDRGWGFDQEQEQEAAATEPETTVDDTAETGTEPVAVEPTVFESDDAAAQTASPEATLMRHKMEAMEDRLERIEKAILSATEADNNPGEAN